jgi:regulator of protease activity HflC (stomatin/prohibitin superfamily)
MMITTLLWIVFVGAFCAVVAAKSIIRVKEDEGIVVFRLGQPFQASGPGTVMVIPFVDRLVRTKLDSIANWQTLPEDQLKEKILNRVLAKMKAE